MIGMRCWLYISIGCALLCTSVWADTPSPVTHFKLANGLTVTVKPDTRAPVAIFQIWYRVGAMDESSGSTGIAHLLEHLMFKGTKTYPEGEFNRIITTHGGVQNAGTAHDFTYYYQLLDKDHIELSFKLESDRMQHLQFDAADFAKELEVVKEERRLRTDNRPTGVLFERFMSAAFVSSPYHNPVVGWMHDLDQLTLNDAKTWYENWYTPSNAHIVVVGDVDVDAIKALAKRYFANIPARQAVARKRPYDIHPLGERRVNVNLKAHVPHLLMGFNTPVITALDDDKAWQPYALEVLAALLDGGPSARLPKDLVRDKQLVSSISVSYDLMGRMPGLFTVSVTPSAKVSTSTIEQAVVSHIKRLQTELVSQDELARVRKQILASKTFSQDTITGQASLLGYIVTLGLPVRLFDDYVDKLLQVTPEQIQQVARLYLTRERLTLATLIPQQGT